VEQEGIEEEVDAGTNVEELIEVDDEVVIPASASNLAGLLVREFGVFNAVP
jgi:hypothetical protein